MTVAQITAVLLGRVSSVFSKAPSSNNYAIMAAIADELEEISAVLEDLTETHHIETANGASLDGIVDLLGISRTSETDTALRTAYYLEQNRRRSCGAIPTLQSIVTDITGYPETAIEVLEPSAGKFSFRCGEIISDKKIIDTDGWGLDEWGYGPWGSAYLVKKAIYARPTKAFSFGTLADAIDKAKAAGVEYMASDIIFVTPITILLRATASTALTGMEWWIDETTDAWGSEPWGMFPWGGTDMIHLVYSGSNAWSEA